MKNIIPLKAKMKESNGFTQIISVFGDQKNGYGDVKNMICRISESEGLNRRHMIMNANMGVPVSCECFCKSKWFNPKTDICLCSCHKLP